MANTYITNVILPEGEPPKELHLLKYGETETTEGKYNLNESGADKVIQTFNKRKLKLYFDYDHKSLDPKSAEEGKAAGWFDLVKKEDGIWATNIKWTETAAKYITNREYSYFSPVIKTDKYNFVQRLINVALTNLPATDNLEPLMELKEEQLMNEIEQSPLEDLETDVKEIAAEVLDQITDAVIEKITDTKVDGEQMKEHLSRVDSALDHAMGLGQHLNKHLMEMTDGHVRSMFEKAHGHMMKMVDLLKEKRKELDPMGMYQEKPMEMSAYKQLSEKVQEVTGQSDFDKQVGTLLALRDTKETVTKLKEELSTKNEEVKALMEKIALKDKEQLVDNAISGPQKKLLLKQRTWALSLNKEQLTSYLENAPVLSFSEKFAEKEVVDEKETVLSELDVTVLSMLEKSGLRVSPEDYMRTKKEKGLL